MKDKITLLTVEDLTNRKYGFHPDPETRDPARMRKNTAYTAARGVFHSTGMESAGHPDYWWLRSPGKFSNCAMSVIYLGCVSQNGYHVDDNFTAVCPALHLNLSSSNLWTYAGTVCTDDTEYPAEQAGAHSILNNPVQILYKGGHVTYDCIYFGRYPQSDKDCPEPIKWRVMEVKDGVALLHADKNLDVMPFNKDYQKGNNWESSDIRKWLNEDFFNKAFTREEQRAIVPHENDKEKREPSNSRVKPLLEEIRQLSKEQKQQLYRAIWKDEVKLRFQEKVNEKGISLNKSEIDNMVEDYIYTTEEIYHINERQTDGFDGVMENMLSELEDDFER